jgi:Spy/CpxP family protein refolding chaperone
MNARMVRNLNAVLVVMAASTSPWWAAAIYLASTACEPVSKELRRMKRMLLHVALACAVVFGGATAFAQTGEGGGMGQGGGQGHGQHGPMSADQRLQMMTQQLNLTTDQQAQIKPILENESQQMQALRQDSSLSQDDRMAKMKQIRETSGSQIKPILTADQQAKWQEMMSHQGHRGAMGPGAGGPPQGAPPSQQNPQ